MDSKKVSADTLIRVKAVKQGVFTGAKGDIIVCDPNGTDPLARFPRVRAGDLKRGILDGLLTLEFKKAEFKESEDAGDLSGRREAIVDEQISEVDLDALRDLEFMDNKIAADVLAPKVIAHGADEGASVDVGGAMIDGDDEDDAPHMKHVSGRNFDVFAPWLAEPIRIVGKAEAEEEVARLKAEGPPPSE